VRQPCCFVGQPSHFSTWVKPLPDYGPLFSILKGLRLDTNRLYWIECKEADGNICDIEVNHRQMSIGVEILLTMSHNASAEEYIQ
jgi:hypothetical protein